MTDTPTMPGLPDEVVAILTEAHGCLVAAARPTVSYGAFRNREMYWSITDQARATRIRHVLRNHGHPDVADRLASDAAGETV